MGNYWMHVFHVLLVAYGHIHNTHALYVYYVHHNAVGFLRSGITSESPATNSQAVHLLQWLTVHHWSPVDW